VDKRRHYRRRQQSLRHYSEAITNYRRSMEIADGVLPVYPADSTALSQLLASGRGMEMAMATAGDRSGAIRQAKETILRAEAGLNAGPDKRRRQRYVAESTMEMGAVYATLAKRSTASRQKQDCEAARFALNRGISQLEALACRRQATIDRSG